MWRNGFKLRGIEGCLVDGGGGGEGLLKRILIYEKYDLWWNLRNSEKLRTKTQAYECIFFL